MNTTQPTPPPSSVTIDSTTAPVPKLTDGKRRELSHAAGLGMPWKLIAGLIELTLDQLQELRKSDPDLAAQVRKAEAVCMQALLQRLQDADQWQAATFVLQSRWPSNFGRNRKPRKRRPTPPPPSQQMLDRLNGEELATYRSLLLKMHDIQQLPEAGPAGSGPERQQTEPPQICDAGVEGT